MDVALYWAESQYYQTFETTLFLIINKCYLLELICKKIGPAVTGDIRVALK